jgi:hypothetical protein
MWELLRARAGSLDLPSMQEILRDRACHPDTLCRDATDNPASDTITFASLVAEPSEGRLTIAVGPPHLHDYRTYAFA